jgi:hypothetical protein
MSTETYLSYLYGALGGLGVLLLFYGLGRVADRTREEAARRAGMWMITAGLCCIAGSAALIMWVA